MKRLKPGRLPRPSQKFHGTCCHCGAVFEATRKDLRPIWTSFTRLMVADCQTKGCPETIVFAPEKFPKGKK